MRNNEECVSRNKRKVHLVSRHEYETGNRLNNKMPYCQDTNSYFYDRNPENTVFRWTHRHGPVSEKGIAVHNRVLQGWFYACNQPMIWVRSCCKVTPTGRKPWIRTVSYHIQGDHENVECCWGFERKTGECFIDVSQALKSILGKSEYCRNRISYGNGASFVNYLYWNYCDIWGIHCIALPIIECGHHPHWYRW